jgi:hypothetical protein
MSTNLLYRIGVVLGGKIYRAITASEGICGR